MPPKRMLTALKGQKRPRFVKISHFWGKNVLSHTFFSKWIDIICCKVQNTSIHSERNVCDSTILPQNLPKTFSESPFCVSKIYRFIRRKEWFLHNLSTQSAQDKIYRFIRRKGWFLHNLSTQSAQHKIYRFIWSKWRNFKKVAKSTFFFPFLGPLNWSFCRNFLTRRGSFP